MRAHVRAMVCAQSYGMMMCVMCCVSCVLWCVCCVLCVVWCVVCGVWCVLCVVCCVLCGVCCVVCVVCCVLYAVCCVVCVVCYMLCVVCVMCVGSGLNEIKATSDHHVRALAAIMATVPMDKDKIQVNKQLLSPTAHACDCQLRDVSAACVVCCMCQTASVSALESWLLLARSRLASVQAAIAAGDIGGHDSQGQRWATHTDTDTQ